MSMLDKIAVPKDEPPMLTITGEAGIGKTSLAALFPDPVFIPIEKGMMSIPEEERPPAFPMIESVDQLWECVRDLITEDHSFRTVVVDSVTELDPLFGKHILDNDKMKDGSRPKSLNQACGGYQAGYAAQAELHHKLRRGMERLRVERGMNVIFIAHSTLKTISNDPDLDTFTKRDLRLHEKSISAYVDNVDLVAYIKQQTFLQGEKGKKGKARSTQSRIITAYSSASCVSKNRFGIESDIVFEKGTNPFVPYIKTLRG